MRYLVPWDYAKHPDQRDEVDHYMAARPRRAPGRAGDLHRAPRLLRRRRRYSKTKACRAPSASAYRKAFRAFDAKFPWVKTYSAWNEINHKSQPTFKSPRMAAGYYNVLRRQARTGQVPRDGGRHARHVQHAPLPARFRRYAKGSPRLWGLHNYGDVNRRRTTFTQEMLRTVPGEVWLTETGGIVKLLPSFKRSPSRAAARTKDMFRLADKLRHAPARHALEDHAAVRLLVVRRAATARFDAGLMNPDGSPRKAFSVFRRNAR